MLPKTAIHNLTAGQFWDYGRFGSRICSYARLLRTLGMILWPVFQLRKHIYLYFGTTNRGGWLMPRTYQIIAETQSLKFNE